MAEWFDDSLSEYEEQAYYESLRKLTLERTGVSENEIPPWRYVISTELISRQVRRQDDDK